MRLYILKDDISKCYKKQDSISEEIKELFVNIKIWKILLNIHMIKQEIKITDIILWDKNRNQVVSLYDWSDHLPYSDHLRISISSNEYSDWLKIAYD